MHIEWSDFQKVDIRVGTILEVNEFPKARIPAYRMVIDFGPTLGRRKTSAQITRRYTREVLVGRQVVAVVNFPKKQIADFMSECLVLGAVGEDHDIVLLHPDVKVENGLPIG